MARSPGFGGASFQAAIADALRRDFGGSPAAVKRVARLVSANERAARNWFDAKNGPRGEHLVALMHHSPAVLESVLTMAGQIALLRLKLVKDAGARVSEILAILNSFAEGEG